MTFAQRTADQVADAELITAVRSGDTTAYAVLYERHRGAAYHLARQLVSSGSEADDVVSETFAKIFTALKDGNGPDAAFRAYLLTTVRNTFYDSARRGKKVDYTDDIERHDEGIPFIDTAIANLDSQLAARAFSRLPERWQAVLWHTEIEGESPNVVAPIMGMTANGVSALAYRAREGLRQAFLQEHVADAASSDCQLTNERLGGWARGGLSKRENTQVERHLEACDRCAAVAAELTDLNAGLRGVVAPLAIGGAALTTAYLAGGSAAKAGALLWAGAGTASAGFAHVGALISGAGAAGAAGVGAVGAGAVGAGAAGGTAVGAGAVGAGAAGGTAAGAAAAGGLLGKVAALSGPARFGAVGGGVVVVAGVVAAAFAMSGGDAPAPVADPTTSIAQPSPTATQQPDPGTQQPPAPQPESPADPAPQEPSEETIPPIPPLSPTDTIPPIPPVETTPPPAPTTQPEPTPSPTPTPTPSPSPSPSPTAEPTEPEPTEPTETPDPPDPEPVEVTLTDQDFESGQFTYDITTPTGLTGLSLTIGAFGNPGGAEANQLTADGGGSTCDLHINGNGPEVFKWCGPTAQTFELPDLAAGETMQVVVHIWIMPENSPIPLTFAADDPETTHSETIPAQSEDEEPDQSEDQSPSSTASEPAEPTTSDSATEDSSTTEEPSTTEGPSTTEEPDESTDPNQAPPSS